MKGKKHTFGYRLFFFIALATVIVQVAAHPFKTPFHYDPTPDPSPRPDSPVNNTPVDSPKLHFPIQDGSGDPMTDGQHNPMDLHDPSNIEKTFEYDPSTKRYYVTEKIGSSYYRTPTYLTEDEYYKYQSKQDEQNYWKRRLDALTLFNKKPVLPAMTKEGVFDRIFGSNAITVRPQGNVDVTFGINSQNIQNPTLTQRAQKYSIFDFDMQMNINLVAAIGDKMKLNISNNTKASFDYQNVQKLEYSGHEDDIIKKIEAGNVSFPLKSTLTPGVTSLFGLKTQLQFGKLWVTSVLSQQKSKRSSLTVQGGSQTQTFGIKADDYEENRHFLLGQYFRDNYNSALKNYPVINSQVAINRLEVWVTNRTGATDGVRDMLCFMDLGEKNPYHTSLNNPTGPVQADNRSNSLYTQLLQNPTTRTTNMATTNTQAILGNDALGRDFERTTARKLNASEFSFNPQLGYISLNTQLNPDDILAVAYRYTYNGKVFQVGEFAEDLPPDTTNAKVMYMKLLKGTSSRPTLPIWHLMMKNIYAIGGIGVSKDDFRLNVLYQNPGGGEIRYIPDGPQAGIPLLTLLNLDRLNYNNDPQPDGIFDFVEGITVRAAQGRVIFPVLEPFGRDFAPFLGGNAQLERKYLYNTLYDSTKTIARQYQQNNRFIMRGSYKSSSSSEIYLGGFNIPPGSVTVTAGGTKLTENVDYQIDYGLGRVKILNTGILSSNTPINIQYEDNATFGFQQQNFTGLRADYYLNPHITLGGTYMKLSERPFSQKQTYGDDPISNKVLGLDANYQGESRWLTKMLDKLPIYSTTASSFITASAEGATIRPGHPAQIDALDPEGAVYIDDFEGTRSSYDLKFPAAAWSLASTPVDARTSTGTLLFPEANDNNKLSYGFNRARLAWYFLEPTLVDPTGGVPDFIKKDPNQDYIRLVQQTEVFPAKSYTTLQNALSTFDLSFFPNQRGPYNFDASNIDADGNLLNPQSRWGGIMRPIEYSDFEASNVEYIEFWVLDPFINKTNAMPGSLYINLGNVSEDVLKDSRKFFENGIQSPKDITTLDSTVWGYVPKFQQQITRSFDNDATSRAIQDVGYDGLTDEEEHRFFKNYLGEIANKFGTTSLAYQNADLDPAADNYHYYRGADYDQAQVNGATGLDVIDRYKYFSNPQGNSPVTDASSTYSNAATNIPESEDINKDNTLNESENYYEYRVDIAPSGNSLMNVGAQKGVIVNKQVSSVKLPNGNTGSETWYQFKIPIDQYARKVGDIGDFRSIRFMRVFMTGFQDSLTLRFAQFDLGRNQWRPYGLSLKNPGENIPDDEQRQTPFTVTAVSLEENSDRTPIPYVIPPGVDRQQIAVSNGQTAALNEQSLSLQIGNLKDGDARGAYKETDVDLRQFQNLRMFMHAESTESIPLKDGDVMGFIRIGSDFTNNYYEYEVPLQITPPNTIDANVIWPERNRIDLVLQDLVAAKTARNNLGLPAYVPYYTQDSKGNTIEVVGNPNIGDGKTMMLGVLNPKKTTNTPTDDGMPKSTEVWFNELRATKPNEQAAYAATGKVTAQLADLGTFNASGSMHTEGYGSIDQKLAQRSRDDFYQYAMSTNLSLGKLFPKNWGVQLPLYVGYSKSVSNPQYDPYDQDVKLKDEVNAAGSAKRRDSIKNIAQDYTSITSVNLTNVRIMGDASKPGKVMPWSIKNFDLTYAYNRQFKRNPTIEGDNLTSNRLALGYTYGVKTKSLEPFKHLIKSKSKWFGLIKDFNITPLPSTFTFRSDMNRIMDETQVRNLGDGGYNIPATYYKNFTWQRAYTLRWELTKSLSFDYSATNYSRIDEPYGRIDTKAKRDSLLRAIETGGRNTQYAQSFSASYNAPLAKLPLTDWINVRGTYAATFNWAAVSLIEPGLGNTISNTVSKQINGDFNFTQLYTKSRWLKALSGTAPAGGKTKGAPNSNTRGGGLKPPGGAKDSKDGKGGDRGKGGDKADDGKSNSGGKDNDDNSTDNTKDTKPESIQPDKITKNTPPFTLDGKTINTANMTDQQLDSVRTLIRNSDAAQKKAAKAKAKAARKAARKLRRSRPPVLNAPERFAGHLLTALKRVTVSYTENGGTILPGYMDSTKILGYNPGSSYNNLGFVYGYQPDSKTLDALGNMGLISRDSLFNSQFQQTYTRNLNITALVEPFPDFRVDLNLTETFSKSHSELFKDTGFNGIYNHLNPYEAGSFTVSYIGIKTLFKPGGSKSSVFIDFLNNREIISHRLGAMNPYTNNTPDPNNPNYSKGYTEFSQDVLVPAFIAAYSGKPAATAALISNENSNISSNPFKEFLPLPNWHITYNGLTKMTPFKELLSNFSLTHAYVGTLSMNSYTSSLLYQDVFNQTFPSFIDSISGNYVPYFQVPNVTINEQFAPLLGVEAAFKSGLSAKIEYRKSRTVALSLLDYQVSETKSNGLIIGGGLRVKGLRLPFPIFGVRQLKNDLNIKLDIGYSDDKTFNTYLAQNIDVTTRGQKVITISPSIDYIVSDKLTLRFFYDRRQTIPYTTQSYPTTTTRGGITLRFIFAQ